MTDLSPSAQTVLDAANMVFSQAGTTAQGIAAALCAAADQVAPSDAVEPRNYLPASIECQRIRKKLFAIATELTGQS